MSFKSKIDWYIHFAFIGLILGTCLWWFSIFLPEPNVIDGICAVILSFLCVVILFLWVGIRYYLTETEIIIKLYGIGKGQKIAYSNIVNVEMSNKSAISATALSLQRIEIKFRETENGNIAIIYISPKRREQFLTLLHEKMSNHK